MLLKALFLTGVLIATSAQSKGPTSFGPVKIGMSKDALLALQPADGIHLSAPLSPYELGTPKPGETTFNAFLQTPLAQAPLKSVLTFEGEALAGIWVNLEGSANLLETLSTQISERYGPGKVEDSRKEEQCIYRNGANFKITSGVLATKWSMDVSTTERIDTAISDASFQSCPTSLQYSSEPIQVRSFSIRRAVPATDTKPKNLF